MMMTAKLLSYAKVNLSLSIRGKRDDGYHLLDSLFAYIDLFDELEIAESDKDVIDANYDVSREDNIISKAISRFFTNYQLAKKTYHIKHIKNIPMGAGLGGGSSNAAVILDYLYKTNKVSDSLENKLKLAAEIGADVPFFMTNQARYISGIGEKLGEIVDFPELPILLIKPKKSLSTKEVFSWGLTPMESDSNLGDWSQAPSVTGTNHFWQFLKDSKNDLEEAAKNLCSEIKDILDFSDAEIEFISKMSGSGSCCFYVFKDEKDCSYIAQKVREKWPEFFVRQSRLCKSVPTLL